MSKKPFLSIIIPSYNTLEYTKQTIKSVLKHTKGIEYEILAIDNVSTDGSVKMLQKLSAKNKELVTMFNKKNRGFAGANNDGIKKAKGNYLLFLNSDTKLSKNIFIPMVEWIKDNKDVGVLGCKLLNTDGTTQASGGYFPTLLSVFSWMTIQDLPLVDKLIKPFHPHKSKSFFAQDSFYEKQHDLDWVTGACMLVKKEALNKVGKFDEKYIMYTEETDLCYRIKEKGWRVVYSPNWSITHLGGASSSAEFPILREFEGVKRFYRKFYPKWQYPILRLLLKVGALGRIVLFGILEGRESANIYAKAFRQA